MKIEIKRLNNKTIAMPSKGSDEAAGFDISTTKDFKIYPNSRAMIGTGFSWKIPKGFYGMIKPRSGLALKHGIDILAGVIDSDYTGEVKVILQNTGKETVSFKKYDRIAQLLILPVPQIELVIVEELKATDRGTDGFGSTGM